jgi:hypothetical protein
MLYQKKAPEILKQYNIRAFPTFIIIDADEAEQMRQVGAPFSSPEDAREWFPKVANALNSVEGLEAKYAEDSENTELALELADTYSVLGKSEKVVEIYTSVAEGMSKEDEGYIDFQFKYGEVLADNGKGADAITVYEGLIETLGEDSERLVDAKLGLGDAKRSTLTKTNQEEVGKELEALYDEILPGLIEAGDDRAIEPAILNARIKLYIGKDAAGAREQMTSMIEPFAENERILEIEFWAAVFAQENGDTDKAKAEYEGIIEKGDENDRWVQNAKKQLEALNKDK